MIFKISKRSEVFIPECSSSLMVKRLLASQVRADDSVDMSEEIALLNALLSDAKTLYLRKAFFLKKKRVLNRLDDILIRSTSAVSQYGNTRKAYLVLVRELIAYIGELESYERLLTMKNCLKKVGIISKIYQESSCDGIIDKTLQQDVNSGYWRYLMAAIGVVFYLAVSFFAGPLWLSVVANGIFAGSACYMTSFIFSGIKNIFNVRACLPYALLGHFKTQFSVMKSNDPSAHVSAWMAIDGQKDAQFFTPVFIVTAVILSTFAHFYAWPFVLIILFAPLLQFFIEPLTHCSKGKEPSLSKQLNHYQRIGLSKMYLTKQERINWLRNIQRSRWSNRSIFIMNALVLGGVIASGFFYSHLPFAILTIFMNVVCPVTLLLGASVFVMGAAIYLKKNQNTILDNRFKIQFDNSTTASFVHAKKERPFYYTEWLFRSDLSGDKHRDKIQAVKQNVYAETQQVKNLP